jgi:uncharacterized UPF0160 family protein
MKAVTHNGVFHADDVFAAAVLRQIESLHLTRTRDPEVIAQADVVFDVGNEYDPERGRFDHHQGGLAVRPNGVPYAAFGLIWKTFGPRYVEMTRRDHAMRGDVDAVIERVDEVLVQPVDAADNGYAISNRIGECREFTVSAAISALNPTWTESETSPEGAFWVATGMAHDILRRVVKNVDAWVLAREVVQDAAEKAEGAVMVLDPFCPWQEHLFSTSGTDDILYVVFENKSGNPKWMVQCVPDAPGSFGKRKPLPESWAGLRGEELAAVTGCTSAVFCHKGRFICGADEFSDAMRMAESAAD